MSQVYLYLSSDPAAAGGSALAPPPAASPPPWPPAQVVSALPSQAGEAPFWIGIRWVGAASALGDFTQVDGTSPPTFTQWAAGVYTGPRPVLACASVDPTAGFQYVPAGCGVQLPALCRAATADNAIAPPPSPPSPAPPPPAATAVQTRVGLYLYSLYNEAALTYPEAAAYCRAGGGYLASFHSLAEFNAVWSYMTTTATALAAGDASVWIGYDEVRHLVDQGAGVSHSCQGGGGLMCAGQRKQGRAGRAGLGRGGQGRERAGKARGQGRERAGKARSGQGRAEWKWTHTRGARSRSAST